MDRAKGMTGKQYAAVTKKLRRLEKWYLHDAEPFNLQTIHPKARLRGFARTIDKAIRLLTERV